MFFLIGQSCGPEPMINFGSASTINPTSVTYTCDTGYEIASISSPTHTITCENGAWSPIPHCQSKCLSTIQCYPTICIRLWSIYIVIVLAKHLAIGYLATDLSKTLAYMESSYLQSCGWVVRSLTNYTEGILCAAWFSKEKFPVYPTDNGYPALFRAGENDGGEEE